MSKAVLNWIISCFKVFQISVLSEKKESKIKNLLHWHIENRCELVSYLYVTMYNIVFMAIGKSIEDLLHIMTKP